MPPLYAAPLQYGDAGTSQTIDKIRELVDDAWRDSGVRRFAFDIVRNAGVAPYDRMAQALAIYSWVAGSTYFLNDPVNKEALFPVSEMLKVYRQAGAIPGDCDDINAVLLPALLGAIGIPTRLVTIATDDRDPSMFSHIYAEAQINGGWIPIDAARPGAQFGVAPEAFYRREWWSLENSAHAEYGTPLTLGPLDVQAPSLQAPSLQAPSLGAVTLGEYANEDPRCAPAVQPAIGPGGVVMVPQQPSVNVEALGWLALGVGVLLLLGGRLK